jgi:hypothetical protein
MEQEGGGGATKAGAELEAIDEDGDEQGGGPPGKPGKGIRGGRARRGSVNAPPPMGKEAQDMLEAMPEEALALSSKHRHRGGRGGDAPGKEVRARHGLGCGWAVGCEGAGGLWGSTRGGRVLLALAEGTGQA